MFERILLGVGRRMVPVPDWLFRPMVKRDAKKLAKRPDLGPDEPISVERARRAARSWQASKACESEKTQTLPCACASVRTWSSSCRQMRRFKLGRCGVMLDMRNVSDIAVSLRLNAAAGAMCPRS